MSYGFQCINDSDVVTLDTDLSRLVILQSGRFAGGVAFSPAITTVEPPLVFVRPDSTMTFQYVTISGSPGNWTGFSYIGGGAGKYFCAAFMSRETDTFGMRLWDESTKLIFDSGTPCAQFTRTITSWTYIGSVGTGQTGVYRTSFTATSPLDTGDYMLINNIGMDVAGGSTRFAKLYCTWDTAGNRIVPFIIGVANMTSFFIPITFAKPISF